MAEGGDQAMREASEVLDLTNSHLRDLVEVQINPGLKARSLLLEARYANPFLDTCRRYVICIGSGLDGKPIDAA